MTAVPTSEVRLRFVARVNKSRIPERLNDQDEVSFVPMAAIGEYGGVDLSESRIVEEIGSGYTPFVDGDVIVAKITPCFENGKGALATGLVNGAAFGTTELHVISCSPQLLPEFAFYLTFASRFRQLGEASMYGAGGQKRVPEGFVKDFRVALPSIADQRAILKFLATKLPQVDDLIAKKRSLLKLLAEKRSALITRAVTKGLAANAPMKASGIDWLGDIPAFWDVKRLRFVGRSQNGINIGGEFFGKGHPFVSYGDVFKNDALPKEVVGLVESSDEDRVRYSVRRGDVLFTRTSETIEEIGISSVCLDAIDNACFAGFLIRLRPWPNTLLPEFSRYYFRNTSLRAFLVKEMNLVTRASLSQTLLGNMPVLLPPIEEQESIRRYIDAETGKIDRVCQSILEATERLTEYRAAIITKAVTGVLEVT